MKPRILQPPRQDPPTPKGPKRTILGSTVAWFGVFLLVVLMALAYLFLRDRDWLFNAKEITPPARTADNEDIDKLIADLLVPTAEDKRLVELLKWANTVPHVTLPTDETAAEANEFDLVLLETAVVDLNLGKAAEVSQRILARSSKDLLVPHQAAFRKLAEELIRRQQWKLFFTAFPPASIESVPEAYSLYLKNLRKNPQALAELETLLAGMAPEERPARLFFIASVVLWEQAELDRARENWSKGFILAMKRNEPGQVQAGFLFAREHGEVAFAADLFQKMINHPRFQDISETMLTACMTQFLQNGLTLPAHMAAERLLLKTPKDLVSINNYAYLGMLLDRLGEKQVARIPGILNKEELNWNVRTTACLALLRAGREREAGELAVMARDTAWDGLSPSSRAVCVVSIHRGGQPQVAAGLLATIDPKQLLPEEIELLAEIGHFAGQTN